MPLILLIGKQIYTYQKQFLWCNDSLQAYSMGEIKQRIENLDNTIYVMFNSILIH